MANKYTTKNKNIAKNSENLPVGGWRDRNRQRRCDERIADAMGRATFGMIDSLGGAIL